MENVTSRQKEIITAAMDIISERGMEGLTMKNIASRVGFSDAAVYRHFKSKSYLLSAMVENFADISIQALNKSSKAGNSGWDQIRQFFFDRCRSFACDRALAAVMFAEDLFKSDPLIASRIHGVMRDHRRLLLKLIRRDQRQGLLKPLPPEHVFTVIMGSLRLLVLQWQTGNYGFELPAAAEKLWQSLEIMLLNKKGDSHEKKNHSH